MGDAAITIMERIIDAKGIKANTVMLAACIWIAARDTGRAISMEDLRKMWGFRMKAFKKCLWAIMDHGIDIRSNAGTTMIITRICSDIGVSMRVRVAAMNLYNCLNKTGVLFGRSPYVVAACIVYIAGDCSEQRPRLNRIASVRRRLVKERMQNEGISGEGQMPVDSEDACPRCGFQMIDMQACHHICPNCGSHRDCSD